jgi:hypothetical protein
MQSRAILLSLGVGAILLAAQEINAQTGRNCAPRERLVEQLANLYGETRQAIGLAASNQVVEVFASLETGTWTITVTQASGESCMVAAGEGFERLDEPWTPAMLGVRARVWQITETDAA